MTAFSWPEFAIVYGAALIGAAGVMPYTIELTGEALKKAEAAKNKAEA